MSSCRVVPTKLVEVRMHDGLAGTAHRGEVRDVVLVHRGRNADDDRVSLRQRGTVTGEPEILVPPGGCEPDPIEVAEVDIAGLDGA